MNKWPKDIEINQILLGNTLDAITFTVNTMHMIFGAHISITVELGIKYLLLNGETEKSTIPVLETSLLSAIGKTIEKAEVINEKDLWIWFHRGGKLEIDGNSLNYECYRVKIKEREIFI